MVCFRGRHFSKRTCVSSQLRNDVSESKTLCNGPFRRCHAVCNKDVDTFIHMGGFGGGGGGAWLPLFSRIDFGNFGNRVVLCNNPKMFMCCEYRATLHPIAKTFFEPPLFEFSGSERNFRAICISRRATVLPCKW